MMSNNLFFLNVIKFEVLVKKVDIEKKLDVKDDSINLEKHKIRFFKRI